MRQEDRGRMKEEMKHILKTYYPPGYKTTVLEECRELGVKPTLANLYDLIVLPFKPPKE